MNTASAEITTARRLMEAAADKLRSSSSFRQLPATAQRELLGHLDSVQRSLGDAPPDRYALTLDTPADFYRRRSGGSASPAVPEPPQQGAGKQVPMPATSQLAKNAGALIDEIDFPQFVAGLISGTFDAMVDSAIRQMEAFADLISAVARNADDFVRDNVTANQAKDWLLARYPQDLDMSSPPNLAPRRNSSEMEEDDPPGWLADFGLAGESLTQELIDDQLVPLARRQLGDNRLKNLATMVLLGMHRIRIKDGAITARVLFRATASDRTTLDYATSDDPGARRGWGTRGSGVYDTHATKVSTVGLNAQSSAGLRAELFGEVKINFESETLPLERLVDQARLSLLQQNSRNPAAGPSSAAPPSGGGTQTVTPSEG